MKIYLESLENKEIDPELIREELTDEDDDIKSEDVKRDGVPSNISSRQSAKLSDLTSRESKSKTYTRRIHYCNHDESKPCSVESL